MSTRSFVLLAQVLMLASLSGCDAVNGQSGGDGPAILLKRDHYIVEFRGRGRGGAQFQTTIEATFTNISGADMVMGMCTANSPDFRLEKKIGDAWEEVFSPICLAARRATPVVVAPGESRTDALILAGALADAPHLASDVLGGTYRLVYRTYGGWDADEHTPTGLAPLPERTSAPFTLRSGR